MLGTGHKSFGIFERSHTKTIQQTNVFDRWKRKLSMVLIFVKLFVGGNININILSSRHSNTFTALVMRHMQCCCVLLIFVKCFFLRISHFSGAGHSNFVFQMVKLMLKTLTINIALAFIIISLRIHWSYMGSHFSLSFQNVGNFDCFWNKVNPFCKCYGHFNGFESMMLRWVE